MKLSFAVFIAILFAASAFGQQSLGDIASENRNKKKATSAIRLDDDNMPRKALLQPDEDKDQDKAAAKESDAKETGKDDKDKDAKKESADAQKDKSDQLQKSIDSQKKDI